MDDISKNKDYQEFFAGIKELAKGLMQIRERAVIEYCLLLQQGQQSLSERVWISKIILLYS